MENDFNKAIQDAGIDEVLNAFDMTKDEEKPKATKKTVTNKVSNAASRNKAWLKKNHAKENLFVVTNIFPQKHINTKNGERIQFNYSVVQVKAGQKFDINKSIYMSVLVNPEKKERLAKFQNVKTGRYSITYRDNKSQYNGKTHVFHNIITIAQR